MSCWSVTRTEDCQTSVWAWGAKWLLIAVIANKRVNADENPCCSYWGHSSGRPEGTRHCHNNAGFLLGEGRKREGEDRLTDCDIDPRREREEGSLRWTRIAVVEDSCSKESRWVSKRTGSTEAVQNITSQEAGIRRGRATSRRNTLDNFWRPDIRPPTTTPGRHTDATNYRPISVIPHVAKIAEKCVQHQLKEYLLTHDFITVNQSAYLPGHSTVTALHKLIMEILDGINEGCISGICLFDLEKCFDTINHSLLLHKLGKYGIRNNEHQWFQSYLSNRKQAVSINGEMSSFLTCNIGVPQGSVLGPV